MNHFRKIKAACDKAEDSLRRLEVYSDQEMDKDVLIQFAQELDICLEKLVDSFGGNGAHFVECNKTSMELALSNTWSFIPTEEDQNDEEWML